MADLLPELWLSVTLWDSGASQAPKQGRAWCNWQSLMLSRRFSASWPIPVWRPQATHKHFQSYLGTWSLPFMPVWTSGASLAGFYYRQPAVVEGELLLVFHMLLRGRLCRCVLWVVSSLSHLTWVFFGQSTWPWGLSSHEDIGVGSCGHHFTWLPAAWLAITGEVRCLRFAGIGMLADTECHTVTRGTRVRCVEPIQPQGLVLDAGTGCDWPQLSLQGPLHRMAW